jgi:hypothetical protein
MRCFEGGEGACCRLFIEFAWKSFWHFSWIRVLFIYILKYYVWDGDKLFWAFYRLALFLFLFDGFVGRDGGMEGWMDDDDALLSI